MLESAKHDGRNLSSELCRKESQGTLPSVWNSDYVYVWHNNYVWADFFLYDTPAQYLQVSVFLKTGAQLPNGRFSIPVGGPVPNGFEVPGTIRYIVCSVVLLLR